MNEKALADAIDISRQAIENAQGKRRMCTVPAWVLDALLEAAPQPVSPQ